MLPLDSQTLVRRVETCHQRHVDCATSKVFHNHLQRQQTRRISVRAETAQFLTVVVRGDVATDIAIDVTNDVG